MRRRRWIGKRGVSQAITDTAIALLTILLCALVVMSMVKIKESSNKEIGRKQLQMAVANSYAALYLKMPVEVEGQHLTMSDLMVLAYYNRDLTPEKYYTKWLAETQHFFTQRRASGQALVLISSPEDSEGMALTVGNTPSGPVTTPTSNVRMRPYEYGIDTYLPSPDPSLEALQVSIRFKGIDVTGVAD